MKAFVPLKEDVITEGNFLSVEMTPEQELRITMNVADRNMNCNHITEKEWHKIQRKAIKKYRKSIKSKQNVQNQ